MALLQELNQTQGLTVVLVTHEPDIAAHAKRIIQLRDGLISSDEQVDVPRQARDVLRGLKTDDGQQAAPVPSAVAQAGSPSALGRPSSAGAL
jgi:ABC-type phosphate/phosphonate transport system ATPase subunit